MKHTKRLFLVLGCILLLTSCGEKEKYRTVSVEGRFSIEIPSSLTKANDLNDEASLQYQNTWKEFYVIVIEDEKTEFLHMLEEYELTDTYTNDLEGYSELTWDNFTEQTRPLQSPGLSEITVNGMPGMRLDTSVQYEGVDIFYTYGIVEGKDRYYQIVVWTLASKQSNYQEEMKRIIESLQEL